MFNLSRRRSKSASTTPDRNSMENQSSHSFGSITISPDTLNNFNSSSSATNSYSSFPTNKDTNGQWKQVKIVLVGEGKTGKTSLFQHLIGQTQQRSSSLNNRRFPKVSRKRTVSESDAVEEGPHVKIKNWTPDGEGERKTKISLPFGKSSSDKEFDVTVTYKCWDFGSKSQLIQQLYFTEGTVYILTFNINDLEASKLDYWLRKIRYVCSPHQPLIFLVATHLDTLPSAKTINVDRIQQFMKSYNEIERVYEIRELYCVSNRTGKGIKEMKQSIQKHITDTVANSGNVTSSKEVLLSHSSKLFNVIPTSWIEMAKVVQKHSELGTASVSSTKKVMANDKLFVDYNQFAKWAKSVKIREDEHLRVAKFLHAVGILYYLPSETRSLEDGLFLMKPSYLDEVVYSLQRRLKELKIVPVNGIVHINLIKEAWNGFYLSIAHNHLLSLLERHDIVFPIRHMEDHYFIPDLIPEEKPPANLSNVWKEITDDQHQIGRVYTPFLKFRVMIDFFPKLAIQLLHHFHECEIMCMWKNGIVLRREIRIEVSESSVLTYYEEAKVEIQVLTENLSYQGGLSSGSSPMPQRSMSPSVMFSEGEDPLYSAETRRRKQYKVEVAVRVSKKYLTERNEMQSSMMTAIVHILDTLFSVDFCHEVLSVEQTIPCPHCVSRKSELSKFKWNIYEFTYKECIRAVLTSEHHFSLCRGIGSRRLWMDQLAPDLAFSGVPIINQKSNGKGKAPSAHLVFGPKIGEGGFSTVYQGTLTVCKPIEKVKQVAIKSVKVDFITENTKVFQEFHREVMMMGQLRCFSKIVKMYGVSIAPDSFSVVLEYLPKGDLYHDFHYKDDTLEQEKARYEAEKKKFDETFSKGVKSDATEEETQLWFRSYNEKTRDLQKLKEELVTKQFELDMTKFSWNLRYKICMDIAQAMAFLHHSCKPPVVHRDLRSPNIFLVSLEEGAKTNAKLGDFGLARRAAPKLEEPLKTWQWLAPEIIASAHPKYDHRSDVYSFGIVCWEIANGLRDTPYFEFQKAKLRDHLIIDQIVFQNLRPTIPAECPKPFKDIIVKCWDSNPEKRPKFSDLVTMLAELYIPPTSSPTNSKLPLTLSWNSAMRKQMEKKDSLGSILDKNDSKKKEKLRKINPTISEGGNFLGFLDISDPSVNIDVRPRVFSMETIGNRFVWVGASDGYIHVYEQTSTTTRRYIGKIPVHRSRIYTMVKINNQYVWIGSDDGQIAILDVYLVHEHLKAPLLTESTMLTAMYSSGSNSLSSSDTRNYLIKEFIQPPTNEKTFIKTLILVTHRTTGKKSVWCLCPVGAHRSLIFIWDIDTCKLQSVANDEKNPIELPEGANIIYQHKDFVWVGGYTTIYSINVLTQEIFQVPDAHENRINDIVASASNQIWSCSKDTRICVWDRKTRERKVVLTSHEFEVVSLCVVGTFIWSTSFRSILVWNSETYECLEEKLKHLDVVRCALHMDDTIWCGSLDGRITVWSATKKLERNEKFELTLATSSSSLLNQQKPIRLSSESVEESKEVKKDGEKGSLEKKESRFKGLKKSLSNISPKGRKFLKESKETETSLVSSLLVRTASQGFGLNLFVKSETSEPKPPSVLTQTITDEQVESLLEKTRTNSTLVTPDTDVLNQLKQ